jgi:hypothetical protein
MLSIRRPPMVLISAHTRYRAAVRAAAALGACTGLAGWLAGLDPLGGSGERSIKLNGAICLLICAGALWVLSGAPSRRVTAVARAAGHGRTVRRRDSQPVHDGRDLGPEELVGRTVDNSSDGAAAAAAVGFALVGGAAAGLDGRLRGRRSPAPLAALTVAVLALGALASHDGTDRWNSWRSPFHS